jgi:hypothetical protein
MTWLVAITIVAGVFFLGFMVGAGWRYSSALETLRRIDRSGKQAEVHDHATEMVVKGMQEAGGEQYVTAARSVIDAYRKALPIATLRVAWQQKIEAKR